MSDACGFCGHADAPKELYVPLRNSIEQLICQQDAREFYVGSQGAFDHMALRALRETKEKYPFIRYAVVLAYLPGKSVPQDPADPTIFPEGLEQVPPRFAISRRNRWMVDNCRWMVAYVTRGFGGAVKTLALARKKGVTVIELAAAPAAPGP